MDEKKPKITFEDLKRASAKKSIFEATFPALEQARAALQDPALQESINRIAESTKEALAPLQSPALQESIKQLAETTRNAGAALQAVSQRPDVQAVQRALQNLAHTSDEDEEKSKPEKLPKTALVIPDDGTRPDGLSTRAAARILYKGTERILQRPERYVLSIFVYCENIDDTTAANNNAKSKMTREEIKKYIFLRNSVFSLYYLGKNLQNEVWTFSALSDLLALFSSGQLENTQAANDPDAIPNATKALQTLFALQRLRLEAEFRAVDFFRRTYSLPEFLVPENVTTARHEFKKMCPAELFDDFADTVQADEIEKMTLDYLVQRRSKFSQNI